MKRLDRHDIISILMIPVFGMFLIGFYLFIGIIFLGVLTLTGLQMLWEFLEEIDFGFDRDYGMDWTVNKRKK